MPRVHRPDRVRMTSSESVRRLGRLPNEYVLGVFARWVVERVIVGAWLSEPERVPGFRLGCNWILPGRSHQPYTLCCAPRLALV
jgi:hypothetical protein